MRNVLAAASPSLFIWAIVVVALAVIIPHVVAGWEAINHAFASI